MPAAARKPKAKAPTRAELASELLALRFKHRDDFDRMEAIKAALKDIADTAGKFRENVAGIGYVSVSPGHPEHKYGEAPALVITAWDELTPARRDKLKADGIVANFDLIKGAYHGRCDVKLFAPPKGAAP